MGSSPARAALLVGGVVISACSYGLTVRADVGLGPLFLVQGGLETHLGWSLGTCATALGLAFLVGALVLRASVGLGSFLVPLANGRAIDLVMPHLPHVDGTVTRLAVCVAATWVMMLGAVLVVRAGLGAQPIDGLMIGLARVLRSSNGRVRLGMELTMVAAGWALGSVVGVGTVLTAVLVGRAFEFWDSLLSSPSQARNRLRAALEASPAAGRGATAGTG